LLQGIEAVAGKGLIRDTRGQSWKFVAEAHRSIHWNPANAKLSFQRRRLPGGYVYFISSWEDPFEGEIIFKSRAKNPEVWNADTGQVEIIENQSSTPGEVVIRLSLNRNDSRFVVFKQ
jgi:hypothetical protein